MHTKITGKTIKYNTKFKTKQGKSNKNVARNSFLIL